MNDNAAITPPPSTESKAELRRHSRMKLAGISVSDAASASAAACARLRLQSSWQCAKTVLFYSAMRGEPDLSPLMTEALAEEKVVSLPRYDARTGIYGACRVERPLTGFLPGTFGILEPPGDAPSVPLNQLDLVLVPGLAFDLGGRRLGRGKGYYDRMLSAVRGIKCGVAFDQQIVSHVPTEPHDIVMNFVLTPTRWLTFDRQSA